jgi:cellulose synthase/poly-beta-1,6-N-acetylglucosamine synthase-like glycosyltransferase
MITILDIIVLSLSAYVLFFAITGLYTATYIENENGYFFDTGRARFLVLVPAHNEGEYLRPTLRSLHNLHYPKDFYHIVVIADNCTDDTERISVQEGCEVWKRDNAKLHGKGHALAWALKKAKGTSWDAAVVIDADSVVSINLLEEFSSALSNGHAAIQARYIFEFPEKRKAWLSIISIISKRAEDLCISRPRSRFSLYQGLQGNGFCLSSKLLEEVPWNAHSICEDLEYGFELANHGYTINYIENACVTATMTSHLQHASRQRQRWAAGTYLLIAKTIPVLLGNAYKKHDWKSVEACVYLFTLSRIPILVLTIFIGAILLLTQNRFNDLSWIMLYITLLLQGTYVAAILNTVRKEQSIYRIIIYIFVYVLWLTFQQCLSILNIRNATWNRTERG